MRGSRRLFLNSSSTSSITLMEEAEDSSLMDWSTPMRIPSKEAEDSSPKYPQYRSRRFFPSESHVKIPSREVEDSSLKSFMTHDGSRRFFPGGSLLLSEFLISNQVMRGRRFLPMHIHSLVSSSPFLLDLTRAYILQEVNIQAWWKRKKR